MRGAVNPSGWGIGISHTQRTTGIDQLISPVPCQAMFAADISQLPSSNARSVQRTLLIFVGHFFPDDWLLVLLNQHAGNQPESGPPRICSRGYLTA